MQRTLSLEQVNNTAPVTNANHKSLRHTSPERTHYRRKSKIIYGNISEHYCIIVKPKLHKSSSLSDLTSHCSDISECKYLYEANTFYNSAGDAADTIVYNKQSDLATCPYMSWKFKPKKTKKKPVTSPLIYNTSVINDYYHNTETVAVDQNMSSCDEYSRFNIGRGKEASFPFKSTPSGNLKVQSNQVVFQSSDFGLLVADPTQAEVKVKIKGKCCSDQDTDGTQFEEGSNFTSNDYDIKDNTNINLQDRTSSSPVKQQKHASPGMREDKGKKLASLGYALADPVDWLRVQLPKKQDLYQEFYRRIHNYINTDTVIHIGDEEFHCHRIVLQVYSSYFDGHPGKEVELPSNSISAEAFQTIYEWMIFNGNDSQKVLKKNNILDVFSGAQFLSIKDLEEQGWAFIVNENLFNEDSAFALFREARVKGMTPVMELMVPRVMRFFLPLVASTDFLQLAPEELMIFLRSNYICVSSEIEVLMAAVRWLYGDWPQRRKYAVDVMKCIRFGLISPWQLVDIKRNPDNAEILEVVNEPDIQQMVDDGLAYVIIKYWYGNNSQNYYHWIDILGLTEPAERNWLGDEKNHVTYKDFLKYLEQFMVPKEQMYQQMAMMQQKRRTEEVPGSFRGLDKDMLDSRRAKIDFPLPAALKGLTADKEKSFPTISEFFENRRKVRGPVSPKTSRPSSPNKEDAIPPDGNNKIRENQQKTSKLMERTASPPTPLKTNQFYNEAERDTSGDEFRIKGMGNTDSSSDTADTSDTRAYKDYACNHGRSKRHSSVAACFLATTTAALGSHPAKRQEIVPVPPKVEPRVNVGPGGQMNTTFTPQISLFNHSKESLARINMNKLSTSILGPSNKKYINDESLFNWYRETVLVFGGTDPHTPYGIGKNTGKDIYRFDPITNVWDNVGELPEPRHHHSVAFLRGRVYLVGKSVVVSTVWSYEPVRKAWYSESGLAVPRKNFGLVVHRMALYAIGGQDKKGRVLRSVERFDSKTSTWSEISPMSVARLGVAATKYREYIWVAGGMSNEKKKPLCRIVECYNSKTDEWTVIHSLRFPRCFCTLFAMNDKLYLIGGAGRVSDKDKTTSSIGVIDVWDWQGREWKQLTEMSIPRHGHALAYLGTQLIIIGGVTTIYMRALNNVESYCCEREAWIRGVAALPSPLSGHGAVTLPPASLM